MAAKGKKELSLPIFVGPFDRHVRHEPAILPEFDLGSDYTIRADFARRWHLGSRVDDRGGMNAHDGIIGGKPMRRA